MVDGKNKMSESGAFEFGANGFVAHNSRGVICAQSRIETQLRNSVKLLVKNSVYQIYHLIYIFRRRRELIYIY
jgi:hypothetical protein